MRPIADQIGETLANEKGMPDSEGWFVCVWRKDDHSDSSRRCTVGEFLSRPENQRGTWLIDGGWGGPPGPIHVRWNEATNEWENGGYCGRKFHVPPWPSPF